MISGKFLSIVFTNVVNDELKFEAVDFKLASLIQLGFVTKI